MAANHPGATSSSASINNSDSPWAAFAPILRACDAPLRSDASTMRRLGMRV